MTTQRTILQNVSKNKMFNEKEELQVFVFLFKTFRGVDIIKRRLENFCILIAI